ncbi:hypothetical protein B0H17DRAFT_1195063 [Mycena rosella]|uniref:Uncharacterized protein n=1 Tax=Mycena rosella TaxID=1033263 RepID=A0AAD7GMN4_MYCRO|nr:hypothetical protein B0H17DRAFT_1195063 [Mycena rosella]
MKPDMLSQFLFLLSVVLIPFILNVIMRYISMIIVSLYFAAYLACYKSPTFLIARLAVSIEELRELFSTAMIECTRALQLISKTEVALTEQEYAVSNLYTKAINAKKVSWKKYPYYLACLVFSIIECQRHIMELRASIVLAIESARQQHLQEEISRRTITLIENFLGANVGKEQGALRVRPSRGLPAGGRLASENQFAYLRAPSKACEA